MNRIVGVIAAGVCLHLCGGAGSAMAQEGELNKQVEVRGNFTGTVAEGWLDQAAAFWEEQMAT